MKIIMFNGCVPTDHTKLDPGLLKRPHGMTTLHSRLVPVLIGKPLKSLVIKMVIIIKQECIQSHVMRAVQEKFVLL